LVALVEITVAEVAEVAVALATKTVFRLQREHHIQCMLEQEVAAPQRVETLTLITVEII
jgi:hypothetical protein